MDAGEKRTALYQKALHLMQTDCNCWTEVYGHIKEDIQDLSQLTKLDPVFIAFSLFDDIDAELDT